MNTPLPLRADSPEIAPTKRSIKEKVARAGGALLASTALLGAGYVAGSHSSHPDATSARPGITREAVRREAIQAAVDEHQAEENSKDLAVSLSESLNHGTVMHMQVLNGEIQGKYPSGKPFSLYKNPILLHAIDQNPRIDASGEFLTGAWFGIQTNDNDGKVVILAEPFDSNELTFVPYDKESPVMTVDVYATQYNVRDEHSNTMLVAFDQSGQKNIANPDQSIVSPGLIVGGGKGGA